MCGFKTLIAIKVGNITIHKVQSIQFITVRSDRKTTKTIKLYVQNKHRATNS